MFFARGGGQSVMRVPNLRQSVWKLCELLVVMLAVIPGFANHPIGRAVVGLRTTRLLANSAIIETPRPKSRSRSCALRASLRLTVGQACVATVNAKLCGKEGVKQSRWLRSAPGPPKATLNVRD